MEVSLVVEAELAETVADLLARHASGGVVLQRVEAPDGDPSSHAQIPAPIRVAAYLPADGALDDRRNGIERGLWHLGQIRPIPPPEFRPLADEDWAEAWKRHYRPIPIGARLLVLPSWLPAPPGERLILRLDPGQAFGTGTHPSTQLCLQLLEDHLRPDARVVDLGCGSGILSLAAARLGARHVLALDVDEVAVRSAAENVERNHLAEVIHVARGSLEILQAGGRVEGRTCDLLAANILLGVLVDLLRAGLGRVIVPGGKVILGGVLAEQGETLEREMRAAGFEIAERRDLGEWAAWVGKKTAPEGAE
ncbi:MAG: 50S ribosomal protein L11 methyltransferase [Anaerolineales bacterium]